ncbi:MAG: hypothetical protein IPI13_11585 [Actinomycetales bacterium]|uniref:Heavy metal transporter n=1 Tax=Candidatus Phosphoribacter hodrii TaxID=2953743 RepID=A0A935IKV5_9MICO|nr:hypothetical protein [Candidatus Phosphoribacter hodrii]MBP8837555.1 hypothetical protein [Dermatophilaceae bacterium]MBK7273767.1 hypothetical protein [Candidatus Phosphoribacter hodrii]HOR15410.1 hypothetical protein [Dermatophilaceae bacterium]HOV01209.1 hypothetical protein [Dermatophilaceae bacterium]
MPRTPAGLILAEQGPPSPRRRRVVRVFVAALVLVVAAAGWVGVRTILASLSPEACWTTSPSARVEVTPEQAGNAATISAVAVSRGLSSRAATIAIATALQESKLRNLRYGDRDSVGLFQQRPSQGWGTVEQILDPVYASNAFYNKLVKVKDYLTRPLTEVAQEVQRSGAPAAYAQHEDEAQALAAALTGAAPATLVCRLDPPSAVPAAKDLRAAITNEFGTPTAGSGGTVTVAAEGATAWALASWAVAHADARGVSRVEVGGRTWSRSDPQTWQSTPSGPQDTVTITLVTAL